MKYFLRNWKKLEQKSAELKKETKQKDEPSVIEKVLDNPVARQVQRTAASIITRSLLGRLRVRRPGAAAALKEIRLVLATCSPLHKIKDNLEDKLPLQKCE